jgi:hypothetical protein
MCADLIELVLVFEEEGATDAEDRTGAELVGAICRRSMAFVTQDLWLE